MNFDLVRDLCISGDLDSYGKYFHRCCVWKRCQPVIEDASTGRNY